MKKIEAVLLTDENISTLLAEDNLIGAAKYLFRQQLKDRSDIRERYNKLSDVLIKRFKLNDQSIELHFNPGRITSTSARTDTESIASRECFLCFNNLPPEQKGILYGNYILLVNPFPIFPQHFTIAHKTHKPQRILDSLDELLLLSEKLSDYLTIFYNGPESGASAPDHLHFQAGTKGCLPLEREISGMAILKGEVLYKGLSAIDDGYRKIILITGNNAGEINNSFRKFLNVYSGYSAGRIEPLLNILVVYDKGEWKVIIFLREKHRPEVFYSKGEDNFLVSPAAADLSGVIITPLRKDFDRADEGLMQGIIKEVSLEGKKFDELKDQLRTRS